MPKLIDKDKFLDLSDYGRFFAKFISRASLNTSITPVHLTFLFGLSGLLAIYFILTDHFYLAAFFIILKSVIDAADGELARMRNKPSYVGRYLDSIFDLILNFMFLMVFYWKSDGESQRKVNFLFQWYKLSYGLFDKIIYYLDPKASKATSFPSLFMTFLSMYGLGFQLLIMSFLLAINKLEWILPSIIGINFFFFPFIWYRKKFIQ